MAASIAVQIPFAQRSISLLDEGSILAIADALAAGDRLYADHVTPLAPLTYELVGALFRAFGSSLLTARILAMAAFAGCVLLAVAILARVVSARAALLAGVALLAVKPLGYPLWTIVNYSQVALTLALAAIWLLQQAIAQQRARSWLVTGLAIGCTGLAKQNLGAIVAICAFAIATLDAIRTAPHVRRVLLGRGVLLTAGIAIPWALAVARSVELGSTSDFFTQAVSGLSTLTEAYSVPLPPAGAWSDRPDDLGRLAFAYFPASLVQLVLEGRLSLSSPWLVPGLELWVKIMYLLPIASGVGALGWLARRRGEHVRESQRGAVVLFGMLAYASMLYRADWAHLSNVSPALICLVAMALATVVPPQIARWTTALLLALWLGVAGVATWAVFAGDRVPVQTPRGIFVGSPDRAQDLERVVAWTTQRKQTERVAFLPFEPLYAFATGRQLLLSHDLLLPGIVTRDGDAHLAAQIPTLDWIVYGTTSVPFVQGDLPDYAPLSAAALDRSFVFDAALSPRLAVLRRTAQRAGPATVVADLWEQVRRRGGAADQGSGRSAAHGEAKSWLFARVVVLPSAAPGQLTCFTGEHEVEAGDVVVAAPWFHPKSWAPPATTEDAPVVSARFEIYGRGGDVERRLLAAVERVVGVPREPLRAPLDDLRGTLAKLEFCASANPALLAPPLAWAAPRVLRPAGGTTNVSDPHASHTP